MRFSDVLEYEDPACAIFTSALEVVFDVNDGATEHIERLSLEARLVYLVWCLDGEIHNGGFDQFFYSSLGNYSIELLGHLETIGAVKSRELLSRAISLFPDSRPAKDQEARFKQLKELETPEIQILLSDLDQQFWKYEDNLACRVNEFVRQHPTATIANENG